MHKLLAQKNLIRNALITIYILTILGISATAKATMEIHPIFTDHEPVQTRAFVGQVAMTADQKFYLIVSDEEIYRLEANIDLFDLNGQQVEIEGVELKHMKDSAASHSLDPLPGSKSRADVLPVLVVFGISDGAL